MNTSIYTTESILDSFAIFTVNGVNPNILTLASCRGSSDKTRKQHFFPQNTTIKMSKQYTKILVWNLFRQPVTVQIAFSPTLFQGLTSMTFSAVRKAINYFSNLESLGPYFFKQRHGWVYHNNLVPCTNVFTRERDNDHGNFYKERTFNLGCLHYWKFSLSSSWWDMVACRQTWCLRGADGREIGTSWFPRKQEVI